MKNVYELQEIAKKVVNVLAEEKTTVNDASYVLDQAEKILRNETLVNIIE